MNVLLAINHESLEKFIECQDNIIVVKKLVSKKNLITECEDSKPDVVVISHGLPGDADMDEVLTKLSLSKIFNGRIVYLYGEDDNNRRQFINSLIIKGIYDYYVGDLDVDIIHDLLFKPKTRNEVKKDIIENELKIKNENNSMNKDKVIENVTEKIIEKTVEKIVGTVTIAVAGTISRIGTTHTALSIAEFLKNYNYKVAMLEYHNSDHFRCILSSYEDVQELNNSYLFDNLYFYPYNEELSVLNTLQENFNYIVLDMGKYAECDISEFKRSNIKIIVSGVKDWEIKDLELILKNNDKEYLKNINYYFNYTDDENFERMKSNMIDEEVGQLNCFQSQLNANPFLINKENIKCFKELLKGILPIVSNSSNIKNSGIFSSFKSKFDKLKNKGSKEKM